VGGVGGYVVSYPKLLRRIVEVCRHLHILQQLRFIFFIVLFLVLLLQHQCPRFGLMQHVSLSPFTNLQTPTLRLRSLRNPRLFPQLFFRVLLFQHHFPFFETKHRVPCLFISRQPTVVLRIWLYNIYRNGFMSAYCVCKIREESEVT
jgi:hypothetical protein